MEHPKSAKINKKHNITMVSTSAFCGIDTPSHSFNSASLMPASVKAFAAACKIGFSEELC